LKTGLDSLKTFYAKFGNDPKKMAAEIAKDPKAAEDSMKALSAPEFQAASSRISAYMSKVCGIKDTSSDTTDTSSPDTTDSSTNTTVG
jgi:hypothetical protein